MRLARPPTIDLVDRGVVLVAFGPGLELVTTAGVEQLDERDGFTWSVFRGDEVLRQHAVLETLREVVS